MKYLIVGTGAVGMALSEELSKRGHSLTLVNRGAAPSGKLAEGVRHVALDARDPAALAPELAGCDVLVHAAGVPRALAEAELPALLEGLLGAAAAQKVPLLYVDTMDAYGDNLGIPMSEATPERPGTPYEALRARLAQRVLAAHHEGLTRTQVARSATLYGPRVFGHPLGEALFGNVVAGKPARILGRLDMPHAFTFVRDLARSLANLSEREESWGRVWHVPCPQPITQKQVLDIMRDVSSKVIKYEIIGSGMMGLRGLFNPELKELKEVLYRYEKPYVVNHSRFSTTFGERTSSHEQAVFETLEWFRLRAGITRRYGV